MNYARRLGIRRVRGMRLLSGAFLFTAGAAAGEAGAGAGAECGAALPAPSDAAFIRTASASAAAISSSSLARFADASESCEVPSTFCRSKSSRRCALYAAASVFPTAATLASYLSVG
jgi:hypothetical protein